MDQRSVGVERIDDPEVEALAVVVEQDGTTAVGDAKHWHLFHIVARKR